MCKTSFIIRYSSLMRPAFMLIIAALAVLPLTGHAQRSGTEKTGKTEKKVKAKKTTRVFYGQASFYHNKFNGRRTANGEIFDQKKFTCACNVLPLGTWVKVTNLRNGKSVVVKTNDRLHPRMTRLVDLSKAAAKKLGYVSRGLTRVKVEMVDKKDDP